jgi:ATP-dependent DNA helicase RecG
VFVSAGIAEAVGERAQYIKNKAMDDDFYTNLIINYLRKYQRGRKSDFINLLSNKLSDVLNAKQKENKVRNILTKMRQDDIIKRADGNQRTGFWVLTIDYRNITS